MSIFSRQTDQHWYEYATRYPRYSLYQATGSWYSLCYSDSYGANLQMVVRHAKTSFL